jgi:3-dehydroquinate dehydratase/shikimate dehydrogenase
MLCISVAPVSRKLAKADLLNAARQCDLVELCLDHFLKEPDVGDILQGIGKPILIACRSSQSGGRFDGTDEERRTLLRQAIVAGPEYIELDLESAAKIPRFGKTKRIVSVTSLNGPPTDLESIFEEAAKVNADMIKFAWPTPTFESAWPMIKTIGQRRALPCVGLGIGRAAVSIAILGRKLGVPWSYAALEKGLETIPGQPTVTDLRETYLWDDLDPKTQIVGLLGPVDGQMATIARTLNRGFRAMGDPIRCLPLPVQSFDRLRERLEKLKITAALAGPDASAGATTFVDKREGSAEPSGYADLLMRRADGWIGYNMLWRHALAAIEARFGKKEPKDRPLERRNVLVFGSGGVARAVIYGIQRRGGIASVTGPDDKASQELAQRFQVRHIPFHNIYDTLTDIVVFAEPIALGHRKTEINGGYFRSSMTVMDLSAMPDDSPLLAEARVRSCRIVEPVDVFRAHIGSQFEALSGKKLPNSLFEEVLASNP